MPTNVPSAGKLNRRIAILQQSGTDSYGRKTDVWSTAFTCWASIDIQQSSLIYETSEFVSRVIYRITMRFRSDVIDATNRVQWVNPRTTQIHTYEIRAALNTGGENRELVLMCYELDGAE